MHCLFCGQLVERLVLLDRFNRYFGLELSPMTLMNISHDLPRLMLMDGAVYLK
jgi:hypothetical protein